MAYFPEFERQGFGQTQCDGIIFDFDGTLADSMHVWTDIDWLFCKEYNLGVPDDFRSSIVGLGFEGTAEYFINELGITLTVEECCQEFNRLAEDEYRNRVFLKPGVVEFLDLLDKRGVPYCIASSLNRRLLDFALENNKVSGRFKTILLCDELQTHKSEPKIFNLAAEAMGVAPDKCFVFEDILPAINTAKQAGMFTVAVVDDENEAQDTPAVSRLADASIRCFREIL